MPRAGGAGEAGETRGQNEAYSVRVAIDIPPLAAGDFSVAVFVYDAFARLETDDDAFLTQCAILLRILAA